MNIGEKIKKFREEKNLSIEKLAELVNVSVETILKYENNEIEPPLDKKLAIAHALSVSLDDLMIHNTSNMNRIVDESILSRYDDMDRDELSIEKNTEDDYQDYSETIEEPIDQSSIEFNDKLFDEIFVGRSGKFFLINIVWSIAYIISVIVFIFMDEMMMAIIIGVLGVFTFMSALFKYFTYRKAKKEWICQYGGKTRMHIFYEQYLIVKDEDGEVLETLFYQNFQSFVEQKNYLIGMIPQNDKQGLLLIVNRLGFENNKYDEVKEFIKAKCKNFIEEKTSPYAKPSTTTAQTKEVTDIKPKEPLNPRLNTILWVLVILSALSISIIRLIINISTGGDDTLIVNLLVYGLGLLLPISSIVMGFISEIHFKQKSRKNLWVGLIFVIICFVQLVSSVSYHIIYTSENSEQNYNQLETLFEIDLPDTYYTIYKDTKQQEFTNDNVTYLQNDYQILRFVKAKEVRNLENTVKSSWQKVENEVPYYHMNDDIKEKISLAGIRLDEKPSYYTSKEEQTHITYLFYFENTNSMLVVTYQK